MSLNSDQLFSKEISEVGLLYIKVWLK